MLLWIILATFINGLVALLGALTLGLNDKLLKKIVIILVAFSAGGLLGGAFFHLIPESIEAIDSMNTSLTVIIGFVSFLFIERYLHWHHCHEGKCEVHAFTYLILVGDTIHNFIDGLVIAAGFLINPAFGVITALLIISHEIPQELGDFGVLVYGGIKKTKALLYNFLSQLTSVAGGIIGYFIGGALTSFTDYMIPFAAGGFIYISASDLIPELHTKFKKSKSGGPLLVFITGLALMYLIKALLGA